MHIVAVGILLGLGIVYAGTGVIDIADPASREVFSGPTEIGEALFYKYTCDDGGLYSTVFDGVSKLFPRRSNTRLINIVLATKDEKVELIQIMYSDVTKDYQLNNLYYRRNRGAWEAVDGPSYKAELFRLKNNNVSFDIYNPPKKGFKQVKFANIDGFHSYVPEQGYELDGVYVGSRLLWDNDPNYLFNSIDVTETKYGPDQIRVRFKNYCAEVVQYYARSGGQWVFDVARRLVDLRSLATHGCQRREHLEGGGPGPDLLGWDDDEALEFEPDAVTFQGYDLCDIPKGDPFRNFRFTFRLMPNVSNDVIVKHYNSYNVTSYEFGSVSGARLEAITDGPWGLYELDPASGEKFFDVKFSHVDSYPDLIMALTTLKKVEGACDPDSGTCNYVPHAPVESFFTRVNGAWYCVERGAYYALFNKMLTTGYQLSLGKRFETPPETPPVTPSTPYLDYGGLEPFTYDLNNPFEPKLEQKFVTTEPDLIRLRPKSGLAMNVVVDRRLVLWEQKESGPGCMMIYIFRSEAVLLAHLLIRSETEPHLFFKHTGESWEPIARAEYIRLKESRGVLGYLTSRFFSRRDEEFDSLELPDDMLDEREPLAADGSGPPGFNVNLDHPKLLA